MKWNTVIISAKLKNTTEIMLHEPALSSLVSLLMNSKNLWHLFVQELCLSFCKLCFDNMEVPVKCPSGLITLLTKYISWAGSPGRAFLGSWSISQMAGERYLHWLGILWSFCFLTLCFCFWFLVKFDWDFGWHTANSYYPRWWQQWVESGFMLWPLKLGDLSGRTGI